MIADTSSSNSGMPADAMSPLALDPAELRRLGYRAVDLMVEHLAGIANGPVFQPMTPDERRALLDPSLPASPTAPDAILEQIREQILSHPMGNGHPRFFGWINSPPVPFAALADLLAAALNPSCAGGDHAAIYLERCVVRWLMELLGFPTEGSMGLLVSGGSMASLTCLAAARSWVARRDGWDVRQHGVSAAPAPLSLYMTEEGHSSIRKAAELMGLGATSLRTLPVDGDFRMDVDALRQAITRDRAAGLRPFCVAASAGTVGRGGSLAARGRGVRRRWRPRSDRRGALRRPRSRPLAHPRSAQVALGACRVRLRAGPRRCAAPRDVQPGPAVPAH